MWKLDFSSNEPVFRQIAKYYEEGIIHGKLAPGSSLPTERSLAKKLGVNRSTVTMAYNDLRSSGLVRSVQGSGTRVSEDLWGVSPKRIPNWQQYADKGMFRPIQPVQKRLREATGDPAIINLGVGELSPDLLPVTDLTRILNGLSVTLPLGYSEPKGTRCLRKTLAVHLKEEYRIQVDPEQILVTSGAQQALHLITQCLLAPGDAVALESPSYAYSLPLFTSAGLRLFPIPMDKDGIIPETIERLYHRHRIRMVFLNPTYQNPTTATLSAQRRKQLLEISSALRLPVVEDDAYGALTLYGAPIPPSPLISLGDGSNILYVGSMSKTLAPGLRMGWVVGPVSVIERLADAKEQMDLGTSAITQQLTEAYLSSGQWTRTVDKLRKTLSKRRDIMIEYLQHSLQDKVEWSLPNGGYHVWCRTNVNAPDIDILEAGLRQKVLVMPGGVYGAGRGFIRLTFARATEDEIRHGMERLSEMFRELES